MGSKGALVGGVPAKGSRWVLPAFPWVYLYENCLEDESGFHPCYFQPHAWPGVPCFKVTLNSH